MKKIIFACLLVMAGQLVSSQPLPGPASPSTAVEDDRAVLHALNAQFIRNFLHNDTVAHNAIIHPDFLCITGAGTVVERSDYMKGWAHGYDPGFYTHFEMRNEFIRVLGNTALVRAETYYSFMDNGKELFRSTVYTDTYLKIEGRWWCVQAQLTPVK